MGICSRTTLLGIVMAGLIAVAGGCGSNWRLHDERVVTNAAPSVPTAPSWVRGNLGQFRVIDPDRIYFVGRSINPDGPRVGGGSSKTPDRRTGFTVLDEREAVQSARNDVYDQIRQRLQPRNFGTSAQLATMTVDSGTCIDCRTPLSLVRTGVQQPCNATCGGGGGAFVSTPGSSGCCSSGGGSGKPGMTKVCSANCAPGSTVRDPSHTFVFFPPHQQGGPSSQQIGMPAPGRVNHYHPPELQALARDINLLNVGLDSIMPALMAKLEEDEIYFERWHVMEGPDPFGRWFATGRDEWQSYKAWVLCSIPRDEFEQIAAEFRSRYNELYEQAMLWVMEDRDRRLAWEERNMDMQLVWQQQERDWHRRDQEQDRSWQRKDQEIARDHSVSLDLDRHTIPRRRFTVLGPNN